MRENGFAVEIPPGVAQQAAEAGRRPPSLEPEMRDLRHLPWSSIDNDTSRDLDQLEVAEQSSDESTKIRVAIADVDAFVPKDSPIDQFAAQQTTTVYTGIRNFSMLPEALSTGVTSLLEGEDRLAVVIEFEVTADGHLQSNVAYRALVRNTAQLTYDAIGRWLDGRAPAPPKIARSGELESQLQLQHRAAQALRAERHRHGALNIETIESRPIVRDQQVIGLDTQEKNSATLLIEDFMIASNEVVARLLDAQKVPFIRRIVRTPARWDRIVALAATYGARPLPALPDSKALNDFLTSQAAADPERFPDLSLAVIKLMGPGEYVVKRPGDADGGHFGLAVDDYTHSTAPNRRFADLVTQRQVKAVLASRASPYTIDTLARLATTCTIKAEASRKVERAMAKRIAAVAMQQRVGDQFDAVVTGVKPHATFVRIVKPHVEGLLAEGGQGLDVGDRVRVTLAKVDVERGFIDFARS